MAIYTWELKRRGLGFGITPDSGFVVRDSTSSVPTAAFRVPGAYTTVAKNDPPPQEDPPPRDDPPPQDDPPDLETSPLVMYGGPIAGAVGLVLGFGIAYLAR